MLWDCKKRAGLLPPLNTWAYYIEGVRGESFPPAVGDMSFALQLCSAVDWPPAAGGMLCPSPRHYFSSSPNCSATARAAAKVNSSGDLASLQSIGYREAQAFLAGDLSAEAAVDAIVLASRQYAKRQRTWFRSLREAHWLEEPRWPVALRQEVLEVGVYGAALVRGGAERERQRHRLCVASLQPLWVVAEA